MRITLCFDTQPEAVHAAEKLQRFAVEHSLDADTATELTLEAHSCACTDHTPFNTIITTASRREVCFSTPARVVVTLR